MNSGIIRTCLLGAVAIVSATQAQAKTPEPKDCDINLRVEVQGTAGFEVTPIGWDFAEQQEIDWDTEQKKFKPLGRRLALKSGVGDVRVKFANFAEPRLSHEREPSAYYVMVAEINGKGIGADAVSVVSREEAKYGTRVWLWVMQGRASERVAAQSLGGEYSSTLPLVFETGIE